MNIHLMIMTAMLSLGISYSCESSDTYKNNGEVCEKVGDCKSLVCIDKQCEPGKARPGEKVLFLEECASQKVSCVPDKNLWRNELASLSEEAFCEKMRVDVAQGRMWPAGSFANPEYLVFRCE